MSCPSVGQFHPWYGATEKLSRVLPFRGAGHQRADCAAARAPAFVSAAGFAFVRLRHHGRWRGDSGGPRQAQGGRTHPGGSRPFRHGGTPQATRDSRCQFSWRIRVDPRCTHVPGERAHSRGATSLCAGFFARWQPYLYDHVGKRHGASNRHSLTCHCGARTYRARTGDCARIAGWKNRVGGEPP